MHLIGKIPRFAASFFYEKFCKLLGSFLKVHRYALSILETAWKFYKIFPCIIFRTMQLWVPEFSMFYKKLACMHECSMENLPADSTRVCTSHTRRVRMTKERGSLPKWLSWVLIYISLAFFKTRSIIFYGNKRFSGK